MSDPLFEPGDRCNAAAPGVAHAPRVGVTVWPGGSRSRGARRTRPRCKESTRSKRSS